jgi:hypothetical protein
MRLDRLPSLFAPRFRSVVDDGVTDPPASRPLQVLRFVLPLLAGLAMAVYAVTSLWYVQIDPTLDDQGLYNPIYLFVHTGHLAYPIYPAQGAENAYFVHPPGDAVLVGSAQWLTDWPVQAAAIGSLLVLIFASYAIIALSRFTLPVKFGFIAGITAGIVVWGGGSFVRPDERLAISFIAGLLALESARLAGWAPGRLLLGAFLVSLSATLHYPASIDVAAVLVYAVWVVRERRSIRGARVPLISLAVGAALVMIPYFFLFVLPFWHDILAFTKAANNQYKGMLGAFRLHREVYHYIHATQIGGPFLSALAAPFTRFGIPLVFVITPILFWRRETRGIAIVSALNLLFLLFFTHTKVASNSNYYVPEFTLYYCCLGYLAVLAVTAVARRLVRPHPSVVLSATLVAGLAVVAAVAVWGKPTTLSYGERSWHPTHADMELARAATEPTLPKNSLVLFNPSLNLWYTTGGWNVYPIWRDLGYASDISQFNLPAYFSAFTAIAGGENETWDVASANNAQHQAIGNWYASGMLKVFRFYFGYHRPGVSSEIRYLLFSTKRQPVIGHVLENSHTIARYVESADGTHVLVAAFCRVTSDAVKALPDPQQAPIFLPGASNLDPYTDEQAGHPRFAMQTFLDTRARYDRRWRPMLLHEGCSIRRVVPMRLAWRHPASQVLAAYMRVDSKRTIRFPNYVRADGLLFAPTGRTVDVSGAAPIASFEISPGSTMTRNGSAATIETSSQLYAEAAQLPLSLPTTRKSWVEVDGKVTRGRVSICLLANSACIVRRSLPAGAGGPFYLPVPHKVPTGVTLYVGNEESSRSVLAIRRVQIIAAATKR